jgi:hypothetical protein
MWEVGEKERDKEGEENPFVLSVAALAAESKRGRDRQQR